MSFIEFLLRISVTAEGLNAVKGLRVDMGIVETNIVSALLRLDMYLLSICFSPEE